LLALLTVILLLSLLTILMMVYIFLHRCLADNSDNTLVVVVVV